MPRDFEVYLEDMREAIKSIARYSISDPRVARYALTLGYSIERFQRSVTARSSA